MVDKIYELKNKILDRVVQDVDERGVERMDIAEVGKMVDMVKDLAKAEESCWEADYYRAVAESMGGERPGYGSGYGYGQGSGANGRGPGRAREFGGSSSRRGYGGMSGHSDVVNGIRYAMQGASPDEKEKMKAELRQMLGM